MVQRTRWGAIALGLGILVGGCTMTPFPSDLTEGSNGDGTLIVGNSQALPGHSHDHPEDANPLQTTVAPGTKGTAKDGGFKIAQPIRCTLGEDCFVLLYPDRDDSTDAKDFTCGQLTYDGHKGTDFAIAGWTSDTDVPVLASASGKVVAIRDGVQDYRIENPSEFENVKGIECGNGVLMDHGQGWSTQYCHLEKGSVLVQQGDHVEVGQPIGMVGLSGKTTFPHVHITIRHRGEVIDPFIGKTTEAGCNVKSRSPLWSDTSLDYVATGSIRSGFAGDVVNMPELWLNGHRGDRFPNDGSALVFWNHVYGVQDGDTEIIQLTDPRGRRAVDVKQDVKNDRKVYLSYAGKTTRNGPLVKGTWTGRYRLVRAGKTLIDLTKTSQVE